MTATEFDIEAISAGAGSVRTFAAGTVIHLRGDVANCAYIIKRGSVEIRHHGRSVETLHPGEIFGEIGLIDGGPRIATAVASERSELIPIDRSLFDSLMRDDDEFARTVTRLMARRHRATIEMFERCDGEQPASPQPGQPLPTRA